MAKFTLALDASQINAFMECPSMWYFQFRMNLEPVFWSHEALSKGTIVHGLLERYYKFRAASNSVEDSCKMAIENFQVDKAKLEVDEETYKFLITRFAQYCANYSRSDYKPLKVGKKPLVETGFSVPLVDNANELFVLEGRIDLMVELPNVGPAFMDHKTQSRTNELYGKSTQFRTYAMVTNSSHGVINYFGLQKTVNEKTFRRALLHFSTEERQWWRQELIKKFYEVAYAVRSGYYEHRWSSCSGKYGYPCQFTKICETRSEHLKNAIIQVEYKQRPEWLPWEEGE